MVIETNEFELELATDNDPVDSCDAGNEKVPPPVGIVSTVTPVGSIMLRAELEATMEKYDDMSDFTPSCNWAD